MNCGRIRTLKAGGSNYRSAILHSIAYCKVGLEDTAEQIQFTLEIISAMERTGDGNFL